ncbi:MAG: endonuclease/exonuclease/phosphatase family protein [Verrucomicrobiae bacterium]|nr:endonuclease/exonuclease/phosphatase family protein [Verrucomicrobiae bacterium]
MSDCVPPALPRLQPRLRWLLFAAAALLATGCVRTASRPSAAHPPLRILTWNIHHGEGLDGRVDLDRIARLIADTEPDLVALQEVDRGVVRTQGRNLPAELAALTGLTAVFQHNIHFQGGEYGNATLTRWPVLSSTNHHFLMLRPGEQRGLLEVVVDIRGHPLAFWNTHIDHRPDDLERWSNVGEIRDRLAASPVPVILAGDFNDLPGSRVHQALDTFLLDVWDQVGFGPGATFPHTRIPKRIDYIWLDRRFPLYPVSARVLDSDASDHLPLLAEVTGFPPPSLMEPGKAASGRTR